MDFNKIPLVFVHFQFIRMAMRFGCHTCSDKGDYEDSGFELQGRAIQTRNHTLYCIGTCQYSIRGEGELLFVLGSSNVDNLLCYSVHRHRIDESIRA